MTDREIRLTRRTIPEANVGDLREELDEAASSSTGFDDALAETGLAVLAAFVHETDSEATLYHYLEGTDIDAALDRFDRADADILRPYRRALHNAAGPDGFGKVAGEALLQTVVASDVDRRKAGNDVVLASDPVDDRHLAALREVYAEITSDSQAVDEALADLGVLAESAYLVQHDSRTWLTLYVESADWEATQEQYAASNNELDVKHRETLAEALVEGGVRLDPVAHVKPPSSD